MLLGGVPERLGPRRHASQTVCLQPAINTAVITSPACHLPLWFGVLKKDMILSYTDYSRLDVLHLQFVLFFAFYSATVT